VASPSNRVVHRVVHRVALMIMRASGRYLWASRKERNGTQKVDHRDQEPGTIRRVTDVGLLYDLRSRAFRFSMEVKGI
jgi:hypothetical protein